MRTEIPTATCPNDAAENSDKNIATTIQRIRDPCTFANIFISVLEPSGMNVCSIVDQGLAFGSIPFPQYEHRK